MKVTSDFELSDITFKDGKTVGKISFEIPDYPVVPPVVVPPPVVPPVIPPVITPPIGGISSGFEEAIRTAGPGKTVVFNKGNYTLPNITVPQGVSIDLGGSTINGSTPGRWNDTGAVFQFKSDSPVNGDQSIKNGFIDGKGIVSGGVLIANRNNVHTDFVDVKETKFFGQWAQNCKNGSMKNFKLHNCSAVEFRGKDNWASGACAFENLTDYEIAFGTATSDRESNGYGFKAMYREKFLTNVKFHHLTTKMHHSSWWNNNQSKNIGFEIAETRMNNLEVYECNFGNQISIATKLQNTGKVRVHHNLFDTGGDTHAMEAMLDDLEFDNNTIRNTSMILVNYKPNLKWKNWLVHHNKFESPTPCPPWGGLFLWGAEGVSNVRIYENDIVQRQGAELEKYMGVHGGVSFDSNTVTRI